MSNAQEFIREKELGTMKPRRKFGMNPLKFLRNRELTSLEEYEGLHVEIWLRANTYLGIGLFASSLLLLITDNIGAFAVWFGWAAWTFIGVALNTADKKIMPFTITLQTCLALAVPFLVCLSMGRFIELGYPAFVALSITIAIIYQLKRLPLWIALGVTMLLVGIMLENHFLAPRVTPSWFFPVWMVGMSISLLFLSSYVLYCISDMHNRALELLSTEQKILKKLAVSDPLTGVFNRRHFFELAHQISAQAERYGRVYSVMIFDLDNFREVNNTLGHPTGDYILREFVRIVQANIRHADIFARYGGEEFVLLLPETALGPALEAAERLRIVISSQPIRERIITTSIGVAGYLPRSAETLDQIVERADQALLRAKSSGKNRVVVDEYYPDQS
jgi:diguanylate cyclase (GGDEF)-like protein